MPNRYYNNTITLLAGSTARGADVENKCDLITNGFATVQTEMDLKAPLANPILTGNVHVPTRSPGDNTSYAASTMYVLSAIQTIGASFAAASSVSAVSAAASASAAAGSAVAASNSSEAAMSYAAMSSSFASVAASYSALTISQTTLALSYANVSSSYAGVAGSFAVVAGSYASVASSYATVAGVAASAVFNATSSTSNSISTGSKTFSIAETARSWAIGTRLKFSRTSAPTNFVAGIVTAYSHPSVTVSIDETGGSGGPFTDWTITLYGAAGAAQPADATLTALAGVSTAANVIPYFTGLDTAAALQASAFTLSLIGQGSATSVVSLLAIQGTPGFILQDQGVI